MPEPPTDRIRDPDFVERVDDCLPQVQCQRCGFAGCRPYAEAIAAGTADFNRCPPGGETTLHALAQLLGVEARPLDPELPASPGRILAKIVEAECIGCTLCARACPVDAIVGARKHMHTVIAGVCTGCGLCVPPCPTDSIHLLSHPAPGAGPWPDYSADEARTARQRTQARQRRLARTTPDATKTASAQEDIRAEIQAAVARARARRNRSG